MLRAPLWILALVGLSACATPALDDNRRAHVDAIIQTVQADAYPELKGRVIAVGTFEEDDAFFLSNFDVGAALLGERRYTIHVNARVFDAGVPEEGLPGVIAHELGHSYDYERRSRAGLLALLPALVFDDDTTRFERWTDLQAVARGYGPSLLVYRRWQRGVLTPEQWARKRVTYYGPDDLALLIDVRGRCPHEFYRLLQDPPRSTREIVTHCP